MPELPPPSVMQDPSNRIAVTDPSLHKDPEAIRNEVITLFRLSDEEFPLAVQAFVSERVTALSQGVHKPFIGGRHGGTDDFIPASTEMVMSGLWGQSYSLDDDSAYGYAFLPARMLYSRYENQTSQEKAYLKAVVEGVNYGQANYFGSIIGNPTARYNLSADLVSEDEDIGASIADYKQVAVCQERAAIAHNMLHIFGIKSQLHSGRITEIKEDGTEVSEAHAFLVVEGSDGVSFIFDPTNPVITRDKNRMIVDTKAATFKIEDGMSATQTVTLNELTKVDGKTQVSRARTLVYIFEK